MSSLTPPNSNQMSALNNHFFFGLTTPKLEEFAPALEATLAYAVTDERVYERTAPEPPDRSWTTPTAAENPLSAWYVTTSISYTDGGPLAGRTVAIKDNVTVAGVPMMNGSRVVEGFTPRYDATVLRRLLDAGATKAGKAVCEDLCFSGSSVTSHPQPVRNPWDESHGYKAGGSSSGSEALVASGHVDCAVGGDGGGSIRIPLACCGIVGCKPTHGLKPYTFPIERTIDHLGPMTRTVGDAAMMLTVLAGTDGLDPRQADHRIEPVDYLAALAEPAGLRVVVVTEGFDTPVQDAAVDDAVRAAILVLRSGCLTVEIVSIPIHLDAFAVWNVIATEGAAYQMLDGNYYGMNTGGFYDPELIIHFSRRRLEHGHQLSKTVKLVGMGGRYTSETGGGKYAAAARQLVREVRAAYDLALARYDVLVMPTLPYTATKIPITDIPLADYLDTALSMIINTAPFDVTGHPALCPVAGAVHGLPVGMMIIGKAHDDDATVLRVAAFEHAVGNYPVPPEAASTLATL
uniref:Enantioselective amidase n=1 Tax=Rhodococcus rhodochrous TaxID=1829 RepID=AMID_RHORH|nr:RecName: Full=Enantioselective amidase [Rhodococcus rhodochrous]